jgi:hypothetical protein
MKTRDDLSSEAPTRRTKLIPFMSKALRKLLHPSAAIYVVGDQ